MLHSGTRPAICVPLSWAWAPREFFISLLEMVMPSGARAMEEAGVEKFWVLLDKSFPLDLSRNRLASRALDLGATHVLFLDADMTFPAGLVEKLLDVGAPVSAALYFKKAPPFTPVPSMLDVPEDPQLMRPITLPEPPGIVECDVVGMGATLIRREVFEKIEKPWFAYDIHRRSGEMSVTEDVTFCIKARAAGFRIACDTRITCGHLRWETVGPAHWEAWRTQLGKDPPIGDLKGQTDGQ